MRCRAAMRGVAAVWRDLGADEGAVCLWTQAARVPKVVPGRMDEKAARHAVSALIGGRNLAGMSLQTLRGEVEARLGHPEWMLSRSAFRDVVNGVLEDLAWADAEAAAAQGDKARCPRRRGAERKPASPGPASRREDTRGRTRRGAKREPASPGPASLSKDTRKRTGDRHTRKRTGDRHKTKRTADRHKEGDKRNDQHKSRKCQKKGRCANIWFALFPWGAEARAMARP